MTLAEEARSVPEGPAELGLSLRERRGQALLGTITAAHFSHHVTNSLLNPLLPLIRDAFAMSYAESGFAVSAFSIASGLANAPWGILADRVGSRTVIVGGLLLMGAVSVALTTAGSYWQLLFFLLLMGVVSGSYHGPAAALIARTFRARLRGTAMGIHITGGHLSFFAAPAVAGILATATGSWRTPYLWFAIAPIAFGGLLWLVAPRVQERTEPGDRFAAVREIANVFRDVGPIVSLSIAFQFGLAAMLAFLALYFVDARGISPGLAAVLFGLPQLAGVIGAPLGGYLSDRFGRRAVMLVGLTLLGPAVLAIAVVRAGGTARDRARRVLPRERARRRDRGPPVRLSRRSGRHRERVQLDRDGVRRALGGDPRLRQAPALISPAPARRREGSSPDSAARRRRGARRAGRRLR